MKKIRVLHADDSAVIRSIISHFLKNIDNIELLESAEDGQMAFDRYKDQKPDIVLMDIEMPVMDGLTSLKKIIEFDANAKVIMCSTLTVDNAEITMQAMKAGAADYIAKPTSAGAVSQSEEFKEKLLFLIENISSGASVNALANDINNNEIILRDTPTLNWKPEVIAIGSSTGGPQALFKLMNDLQGIDLPVVITQHMPPTFTNLLARHITENSGFPAMEALQGQKLVPGKAIVAQGGKHMEFTKDSTGNIVTNLTDGPAENFCKPAVDPMYRSLVRYYGDKILSVVLTGMGSDGVLGVEDIVSAGGYCVAQDEKTSVVWGMPGAVASAGLASAVLPLNDIGRWIHSYARSR